nr:RecName: Full=Phospholipase A2 3; Short=svPLA2; AltName: Full=Phosphatidylcholine 2-acylhydrolase [Micrurus nigrocinctus]
NLYQFKNMIKCTNTRMWWSFTNAGCYDG